jgi:hypothetical protein
MRLIRLILPALLTCALLAGCGGDSGGSGGSDRFNSDYKAVNDQLLQLGTTVSDALQKAPQTTDPMLAGEFSGFANQLDEVKGRLDVLKPPPDVKSKVEALSLAIGKLAADLRNIAHAATVHDTTAARDATKALVSDSRAAGAARRALARKTGARVGS